MENKEKTLTKEEKVRKLLSPKLDIVFQTLFGEVGNERITKKFLEAILDKKLEEVDFSGNIVLRRERLKNNYNFCVVKLHLKFIQRTKSTPHKFQTCFPSQNLIFFQPDLCLKKGMRLNMEDNVNLKKTIEVLIVNFEIKELKELEYHSKWKIIEEKYRKHILTEDLEIHIIEMPKVYKIEESKREEELMKWIYFIEDPESEEVGEYMKDNQEMKEAKEKLEIMSEDEKMQRLAELREKAIMDEKAIKRFAMREGREEGRKLGREEGRKEGLEEGIKETAKKMKEKGADIKFIQEVTNLTEEEINAL